MAVLVSSAAFMFSPSVFSQAPIVDASSAYDSEQVVDSPAPQSSAPAPAASQSQGELFYQLQLLQDEVRMLRGLVEDQTHQLQRLKQQSTERYIDIDRRLANVGTATVPSEAGDTGSVGENGVKSPAVAALSGEKEAYDAAYSLVNKRQFPEALSAFQQFLMNFPEGKYSPNAYYWLGELYLAIKPADLEASRQSFAQLLELHPKHAKAADAMYKLGTVYFLKDNKEKSRHWLEKVIAEHGNGVSSAAGKAKDFLRKNF